MLGLVPADVDVLVRLKQAYCFIVLTYIVVIIPFIYRIQLREMPEFDELLGQLPSSYPNLYPYSTFSG